MQAAPAPIAETKNTLKKSSQTITTQGVKYRWNIKRPDDAAIRTISNANNLSLSIAHVLFSRGYIEQKDLMPYLFSSFEQDVPNPRLLKDAQVAADRILKAIEKKEKILIFGDYDVDGATSTSLMLLALIPLDANINYFLPNRVRDGYGLSKKIVTKAADNDYQLIVTVDNGITSYEAAEEAEKRGIDLIITDHHRQHDTLPTALAIINPNQFACEYPFKSLAGVGVIFKIMCLIYEMKGLELPQKVYELLLLGTIADVVPMLGENRYWVRHGLGLANKNRSIALETLMNNGNLTKSVIGSLDIGFMIAPQINALGRLDDSREAVKFLISSDVDEVQRIGLILKNINEERKRVERGIFDEVEGAIANQHINLEKENVILAAHENWPAGVIGLVAGKLAHNYGRPTFLFHHDKKNGLVKGSCRSIPEFNVFDALTECKDMLLSFGGHSFAAGLKLKASDLPKLKAHLEAQVLAKVDPDDLIPKITADAYLELGEVNNKIISDMSQLEPFGNSNPQPTFIINDVTLVKPPTLLKDKHVKAMVFADGILKPVVFFNRPDIYKLLKEIGDAPFNLAGHVMKNEWQGNVRIELQGIDIALP